MLNKTDKQLFPISERSQGNAPKTMRVEIPRNQLYEVLLTNNTYQSCSESLKKLLQGRKALVVTSPTVVRLHGYKIWQELRGSKDSNNEIFVLDCTERTKTVDQVIKVCIRANEMRLGRQDILVAIGGGVCMDITTVAASWLYRGVGYIKIPTTLIGQVDAGIGIKGAVNFQGKKSYIGCFHPPRMAIISPFLLQTLPIKHIRSGIAEIVKIAIICDSELFATLEQNAQLLLSSRFQNPPNDGRKIIWQSIKDMLGELDGNIYEDQSYRRKVDLGHTVSPALEAISGFNLTHGEAVAIDLSFSVMLSYHMKLLNKDDSLRILSLLMCAGLPIWTPELSVDLCREALEDIKSQRGGEINMVIPTAIGDCTFLSNCEQIGTSLVKASLDSLHSIHRETAGGLPGSSNQV